MRIGYTVEMDTKATAGTKKRLTAVMADDHQLIRVGLKSILSEHYQLELLGETDNGSEACMMIRRQQPEIAFLDLNLPELSGLQIVEELRETAPYLTTKFIILTMHADKRLFKQALKFHIDGYLLKADTSRCLPAAVEALLAGKNYYSKKLEKMVFEHFIGEVTEPVPLEVFTRRELHILRMIANGLTNRRIAEQLQLSSRTVEFHRGNINRKLGTNRVSDLTRYAINMGLV